MIWQLRSLGPLVTQFRTDTLIYSDANHFNDCPLANDRSIVPWSSTITDTILVLPEVNEADDDRAEDPCVRQLNSLQAHTHRRGGAFSAGRRRSHCRTC